MKGRTPRLYNVLSGCKQDTLVELRHHNSDLDTDLYESPGPISGESSTVGLGDG